MSVVNKQLNGNLNSLLTIFDSDFVAVSIFRKLLSAVVSGDINSDANIDLDDEVLYNYVQIRQAVDKFVQETIYEPLYANDTYDGLIAGVVDIYSCLLTVIYMRKLLVDVDVQPESVIDEYLKSFDFPCRDLFNAIQKKEIARNVYGYLRKKGTPALLKRLLQQLGFNYFCIIEYWLTYKKNQYVFSPEIISQVTSNSTTTDDWSFFISNKDVTLDAIRQYDPLWLLDKSDIDELESEGTMTLPAKSPYYQLGVAISTTNNDKLVSSMLYAMTKKVLYNYSIGEDVKDIKYPPYRDKKVSILDIMYAWAFINFNYGKIYDIFGLNSTKDVNQYDEGGVWRKYDLDMVYDTISKRSIGKKDYDGSDIDFDESYSGKFDTNFTDIMITENVFGWNKDITKTPINDILKEIKELYDATFKKINYYPSKFQYDSIAKKYKIDNNKSRLADVEEIKQEYFIAPALFGDIDDTLKEFYKYNPKFYNWVQNQMNLYGEGTVEKSELCLSLLKSILGVIERYIYRKSNIFFNLQQYLIKNSQFRKTTQKLGKGFMPYHAKMLAPFYLHIIKDLPYDQVLISDLNPYHISGPQTIGRTSLRETFWRAEYQQIFDIKAPDPYATVFDWYQHYEQLGYDHTRTITVNGKTYAPRFDFEADEVKTSSKSNLTCYSGYKSKTNLINPEEDTSDYVKIETKIKQSFTVLVDDLKTTYTVFAKRGTDITEPKKILAKIPLSQMNVGVNYVEVSETSYHFKFDNEPFYRTLPNTHCSLNINSFDDPRWNDRFDTIHVYSVEKKPISKGLVNIGSIVVADIMVTV